MVPDDYRIDVFTERRLEKEMGASLPRGALEALIEFERKHPELAEALRNHVGPNPEFTWLKAMLLAHLGPRRYAKEWGEFLSDEVWENDRIMARAMAGERRVLQLVQQEPSPSEEGEGSRGARWSRLRRWLSGKR
jgi:hypothetical protein